MPLDADGFLRDPESPFGSSYRRVLSTLEGLDEIPSIVIIGEPGMGKTFELERYCREKTGNAIYFNLRDYDSNDIGRLGAEIMEHEVYQNAIRSSTEFYLLLDSYDEGHILIRNLTSKLIEVLRVIRHEQLRLRIRIACRSSELPELLVSELNGILTTDVRVFSLARLRNVDVESALEVYGIPKDDFYRYLFSNHATAFASTPLTLQFLIAGYETSAGKVLSKADLYENGCRSLVEEHSDHRNDLGVGTQPSTHKLNTAGWIATVMIFSRKNMLSKRSKHAVRWSDAITVDDLCVMVGATVPFDIGKPDIEAVLNTLLFTSGHAHVFTWAHRSYAEYLAARFLRDRSLNLVQLKNLFVTSDAAYKAIQPQLRGVAGWLAAMQSDFRGYVIDSDPETLLGGSPDLLTSIEKSNLIDKIFESYQHGLGYEYDRLKKSMYSKLKYDGIGSQLRVYVNSRDAKPFARQLAIELTKECGVVELTPDLIRIALDSKEPLRHRVDACSALSLLLKEDGKETGRLMSLLDLDDSEDPDCELRGYGLKILWPKYLSDTRLVEILQATKVPNLVGSYVGFLWDGLFRNLTSETIAHILNWGAADQKADQYDRIGVLLTKMAIAAYSHVDDPVVLDSLARYSACRIMRHRTIVDYSLGNHFWECIRGSANKRQVLVERIIVYLVESNGSVDSLIHDGANHPLLYREDIIWILDRVKENVGTHLEYSYVRLAWYLAEWNDGNIVDTILTLSRESIVMYEEFRSMIDPIDIDSVDTEALRKEQLKRSGPIQESIDRIKPYIERMDRICSRFFNGETSAWIDATELLCSDPGDSTIGSVFDLDLARSPGWGFLPDDARRNLFLIAYSYLGSMRVNHQDWIGKSVFLRSGLAAYKAIHLLYQFDVPKLNNIDCLTWRKWAPIVLGYSNTYGLGDDHIHQQLISIAYTYAPEEIHDTFRLLLRHHVETIDTSDRFEIPLIANVGLCWNSSLEDIVYEQLISSNTTSMVAGALLQSLFKKNSQRATEYALLSIEQYDPNVEMSVAHAYSCVRSLLSYAKAEIWDQLWKFLTENEAIARNLLLDFAYDNRHNSLDLSRLAIEQLATLYIQLAVWFPPGEDPNVEGAHMVGDRELLGHFRNSILTYLVRQGEYESIVQFRRALPDIEWLEYFEQEARETAHQLRWEALSIGELFAILQSNSTRLVRSGKELVEVLCESINRLADRLHGETPLVENLWDRIADGKYRPRGENRVSDFIKSMLDIDLRGRGIIHNREVEIRSKGENPGQRTDIHVDAVSNDSTQHYETIKVIIEVKCVWNRNLDSDMEKQLLSRYLKDNDCQHGIYLVVWFESEMWADDNRRKAKSRMCALPDLRDRLMKQAASLSGNGKFLQVVVLDASL